jgi:hyaluronate lyase
MKINALRLKWLVSLILLGTFIVGHADEYDDLRLRWKTMLIGGDSYDVSDPDIAERIVSITTLAKTNWVAMDKSAGRTLLWSDLNLITTDSYDLNNHYNRLKTMALAYSTKGSSLYQDEALLADTIAGLDFMYSNYYNETKTEYGNWYHWEINIPLVLNDCTVLLYDKLSAAQRTNYMRAIDKFVPAPSMTGANRVMKVTAVAVRGIIVKDSAKIASARTGLNEVFSYVTKGDGFYRDGSFVQHLRYAYNGGYGLGLIEHIGNISYLLGGSTWQVTDSRSLNIFKWVYDSYDPFVYKGVFMDMVRGRGISRYSSQDHNAGANGVRAIIRIAQFAPPADATQFRSIVKDSILADTAKVIYKSSSIEMILLARAIANDSNIPARGDLIKYKQFPGMDRVVQSRPGFRFGVSMCSTRIANFESINDENLKGWYTGEGMTYLYNADLAQYNDHYWPTVDSKRLAGTTIDAGLVKGKYTGRGNPSTKPWVGGAELLGSYGVTGMEVDAYGCTLTAKKSWFMFDDEIVALGAGINSTDNRTIETIVDNRKISGDNTLIVNGASKPNTLGWSESMTGVNWIHLGGKVSGSDIGYYFPNSSNVKGLREARTGRWADLNLLSNDGTNTHTRNYLTLWCDHGKNPKDATYSYVIMPNKTSVQLNSYASMPDITIVTNSVDAQAVRENKLNILGVNFWTDKTNAVDLVTSDKKAAVMIKENPGTDIEVGLSDPTQLNTGVINIEIARGGESIISTNAGVSVVQLKPTIKIAVNVNASLGKTFKAKFAIAGDSSTLDSDLDGLPDVWEVAHFGNIADPRSQADLDPDGDGSSNEAEYKAGTSPIDSSSRFSFSKILQSASGMEIEWKSVAGKTYDVQISTNLTNWTTVDSVRAASDTSSWIDFSSTPSSCKFYRVRVQ